MPENDPANSARLEALMERTIAQNREAIALQRASIEELRGMSLIFAGVGLMIALPPVITAIILLVK